MYAEMLLIRGGDKYAWESRVSKYTVQDINFRDFKSYLDKAKKVGRISFESDDPEVVLNKLELVADDGIHLLNAGAVLFCDCSETDVQMAKFATDVKATFTDIRREDKGSIIGMSKICEQYIVDAMDWKADIIGFERVETPEIPVEAIREAVINSYGHRVYNNNQNNEIDVFKDRIEIHTTGGFPKGHTPEEYLDGNKKPIRRNRRITGVLYYSKDMETFATGLKRIKDLCDEAGCKVEFRTEKDDFVVAFYRNLRDSWNDIVTSSAKDGVKSDVNLGNTTKKLPRNYQETTKTSAEKIKEIMQENPVASAAQIAVKVGISVNGVQYHIKKMKASGEIERVGSDRGGHWKVNN